MGVDSEGAESTHREIEVYTSAEASAERNRLDLSGYNKAGSEKLEELEFGGLHIHELH